MNVFDYLFSETKILEKKFLIGAREEIDFINLHSRALNIATYIQKRFGAGKNIILLSHNNLFFIECYLGIIKSGNAVVPLNPAIEAENLEYIRSLCEADTAFVSNGLRISTSAFSHVFHENEVEEIHKSPLFENDWPQTQPNDTAEIIFTSGSTGVPKGVMLSHKNIIANTDSIIQYLQLSDSDTMLVVLPFYYCYGLSLLHTHLKAGGSIALNNSFIFLGGILRDLNLYQCTGFAGVPSHFQILLRKSKTFTTTQFPSLRYVTQAGGKLPNVFIKEFSEAFPHINFYVMYGQTEATARLSYLPPEQLQSKTGSIGKGIPGVTLKVVDEKGNQVIAGDTGEIIASGGNIMKGYYKDAKLTSQTIKNGWLYTGDLATIDNDGYIYIESRKKEILKVGGKRVSPKEIEEVITLLPEVIDCVISGVDDPLLGEALKAQVIINADKSTLINPEFIREHCKKHLSLYKVPTYIEVETTLQITATGKKVKNVNS